MGWMEFGIIIFLIVLPVGGIALFLWFIKAGSKAYNKGKLEAESQHRNEHDKTA
jgi:hypothetical protein